MNIDENRLNEIKLEFLHMAEQNTPVKMRLPEIELPSLEIGPKPFQSKDSMLRMPCEQDNIICDIDNLNWAYEADEARAQAKEFNKKILKSKLNTFPDINEIHLEIKNLSHVGKMELVYEVSILGKQLHDLTSFEKELEIFEDYKYNLKKTINLKDALYTLEISWREA